MAEKTIIKQVCHNLQRQNIQFSEYSLDDLQHALFHPISRHREVGAQTYFCTQLSCHFYVKDDKTNIRRLEHLL